MESRTGIITFKGNPMTLLGPSLGVGDTAPDFHLTAGDLSIVDLDKLTGGGSHAAMLIVVPSLDTGVCSLESQKFNARLGELPAGVVASVVSMDLPFAQGRWCGAQEGGIKLGMLSDYRDHSFGLNFGLLIGELGLLSRAIVVVGRDKKIRYLKIVPEVTHEPDYDEALKAAAASAA
ncbi:MAG: thiol peroxidase [Candidatus Eremiobacteraeota bacterium]|nr:thiol peroxidase [Candidatus Eremiobacteraeota bacterium]